MIRHGQVKIFLRDLLGILLGVGIVSIPVIVYFGVNHAFDSLWEVYFYDNIFVYQEEGTSKLYSLLLGFLSCFFGCTVAILSGILGTVYAFFRRQKILGFSILSSLFFLLLITFVGGRYYVYYSLIFGIFLPFLIWIVYDLLRFLFSYRKDEKKQLRSFGVSSLALTLCGLCLMTFGNHNLYLAAYEKEDLPQYRFAAIMAQTENPTLLNYGFLDGGFYTAADIVPSTRYFCQINMKSDEMIETQMKIVREGLVDYVVMRNGKFDLSHYDRIAECSFPFEGYTNIYYLYRLQSLGD